MTPRRPEQKRYPRLRTQGPAVPYAEVKSVPAPGLMARFLYRPTPCARCGSRNYVRHTVKTDKCVKCGKVRK